MTLHFVHVTRLCYIEQQHQMPLQSDASARSPDFGDEVEMCMHVLKQEILNQNFIVQYRA